MTHFLWFRSDSSKRPADTTTSNSEFQTEIATQKGAGKDINAENPQRAQDVKLNVQGRGSPHSCACCSSL